MWEWSNRSTKPLDSAASKSLLAAYNDLLLSNTSTPAKVKDVDIGSGNNGATQPPSPSEMKSLLVSRLRDYGFRSLELKEYPYEPQTWQEMNHCSAEYQRIREVFLKLVGYSYSEECTTAGLSKADISMLRRSLAPENWNTHLKVPFDFGGTLDFDNLCLIKTHPVHDLIHRLIDLQIENNFLRVQQKIYIPWIEGKICHE